MSYGFITRKLNRALDVAVGTYVLLYFTVFGAAATWALFDTNVMMGVLSASDPTRVSLLAVQAAALVMWPVAVRAGAQIIQGGKIRGYISASTALGVLLFTDLFQVYVGLDPIFDPDVLWHAIPLVSCIVIGQTRIRQRGRHLRRSMSRS